MLGHEKIFSLRSTGFTPRDIFVDESNVFYDWYTKDVYGGPDHFAVCILPDETLEMLDLRFCVGLVVHISSSSEKRVKELLEAFKKAGAKVVASIATKRVEGKSFYKTEWSEIWLR